MVDSWLLDDLPDTSLCLASFCGLSGTGSKFRQALPLTIHLISNLDEHESEDNILTDPAEVVLNIMICVYVAYDHIQDSDSIVYAYS